MDKVAVILKSLEKADYTKIGLFGRNLWDLNELMKQGYEFLFKVEECKLLLHVTSSKDFLYNDITEWSIRDIIFDPEFAKGMWGEAKACNYCGGSGSKCCGALRVQISLKSAWHFHIQELVIADSYFEYLKQFLK